MDYEIVWVRGHIEVYDWAGRFCFSADSEREAREELEREYRVSPARAELAVDCAQASLAVDRDFKDKSTGEKSTDFIDIVAWRQTAEFICKYFTKGRMISVDGRLQTRGWKDREGNNRVSIEILVDNAYFADSKKDDAAGDFPADDQFAGYGAYQGSVPGGGDDFAPDF